MARSNVAAHHWVRLEGAEEWCCANCGVLLSDPLCESIGTEDRKAADNPSDAGTEAAGAPTRGVKVPGAGDDPTDLMLDDQVAAGSNDSTTRRRKIASGPKRPAAKPLTARG